ncbi:hypothetical protein [Pseudoalteromonas luteoviolacea]|uniref:hypothetical protein n=1 Tax=Pseudoalteromonas luteoviolacea TaxID=43657 RepID=UPI00114F0CBD|nr:hypothetical protein [Pseudoalteromonas luteoviolacea]TQF67532.1 hypothetical protein FLM44_20325 [Pseudoalteromonas luteoviolacea]
MNRWILFFIVFSGGVAASTEQLDQRQCARFTAELEFLRHNSMLKEGEEARLLRLLERLQTYCKVPKDTIRQPPSSKNQPAVAYGGTSHKNQETRERWLAYFQKPMICHHGAQDFASAVKCAEQVAIQRQAFEVMLRKEQEQAQKIQRLQREPSDTIDESSFAESATENQQSAEKHAVEQASNKPSPVDFDVEETKKGHFDRFIMWLSVIAAGYIIIELIKFRFKGNTSNPKRQKRSFINTYKLLTSRLDNKKYIVLYRSMSPLLEELDIDAIVLSPFGVFALIYCPQVGIIEADIQGEMWNVIEEGSSNFFLNPANVAKVRIANLSKCIGAKSGVRCMIVFDDESEFYPGQPFNCFRSEEVAIEVMRYTQYMFSFEQLRYFEQRLFSAESLLTTDAQLASNS